MPHGECLYPDGGLMMIQNSMNILSVVYVRAILGAQQNMPGIFGTESMDTKLDEYFVCGTCKPVSGM